MSWIYITEAGARLGLTGGRYVISRENEALAEIPSEIVEGVTVIDSVQLSSHAIVDFLRREIPVTWLSTEGKFFGRLESTAAQDITRIKEQFHRQEEAEFSTELTRLTVFRKVYNQRAILRNYNRRADNANVKKAYEDIRILADKIHGARTVDEIMGYEGAIARIYFQALNAFLPEDFRFEKWTKRPPKDCFNSMLSFGYTLLMYDFYSAISRARLNPYIGFCHALKDKHPALASDLMEPWRAAVVDSFCLALVTHREIDASYFMRSEENDGVYLNRVGRRIFIQAYERKMRSVNSYFDGKYSWRHTVQMECDSYRQAVHEGDPKLVKALVIR